MYLLDTNVVSELRKAATGKANHAVTTWAENVDTPSMYLSVVSVLELELGILLMERRDPAQGALLRAWMENQVLPAFAGRILEVDTMIAQRCATLHVPDPRSYRDSLIAATAMVHSMTVVTRNIADFASTGVSILDPWQT
jgi:predicted nucleic acid-binding protein